ncbi:DUF2911 domain-containing protein [Chitinophaga sp. GCM10012297]|uniref:DUF2911 domain-containing protein n=1 Tax=Chitinophaga chungangae TaxID=2821488 RepID=A0ABS3YEQ6_9BACT|nr:DUF2911 domain-containing protein [Chitinophaga chungangae]MBO9153164.1 DUF2911 domain-containing protein [Chitinophaga chungangae]
MNTLKSLLVIAGLAAASLANAQEKKMPPVDPSPMDMAYYPVMYPYVCKVKGEPGTLVARAIFSRPQKKGRPIFGNLVEYGKVWRLGANEATEVEFYRPVVIGNKTVPKGRYTLYVIPTETKWTVIINKQTDIWGAYKYESSLDLVRTDVPVTAPADEMEAFSMVFEKAAYGANLLMGWDKTMVSLPIRWTESKTVAATTPAKKK